jgi:hypothetical protein
VTCASCVGCGSNPRPSATAVSPDHDRTRRKATPARDGGWGRGARCVSAAGEALAACADRTWSTADHALAVSGPGDPARPREDRRPSPTGPSTRRSDRWIAAGAHPYPRDGAKALMSGAPPSTMRGQEEGGASDAPLSGRAGPGDASQRRSGVEPGGA